jgi:hypothetical protein
MEKKTLILVLILLLMSISFITSLKSVKAENNITIGWSDYATVNQVGEYKAQQGFVLEIVNISIANNGYNSINTNPHYFTVTSAKSGNVFNYTTYAQDDWVTWDVYNGMTFYGALVFEMPVGENEISHLSYNTTSAGENYIIVYTSFNPNIRNSTPTPTALTATPVTPEFSAIAVLAIFLALTLFAVTMLTIRKRKIQEN